MRNYFILLASLTVAGCMMSEISEETVIVHSDYPIYTAAFDNEDTKVYVDTDLKMHWNAGNEISIFSTTGNQRYRFDGSDGDREGTFSLQGNPQSGSELQKTYAVYPYSEDTSINADGVITLNLPSVQNYAENSFGPGANTMVAVTENKDSDKLFFKNLCGYLVVKLYGEGTIKSITLTGNNGEKLSGQATVAPVFGEAPVLTMSESAGTSITLDCGEGVVLGATDDSAISFWFAVPPVTFSKGFTIEITDGASCSTNKETSIERAIERNTKNAIKSIQINQMVNQLAMERRALIAIYNALDGEHWSEKNNWCSDKPVNEWQNVYTRPDGTVNRLFLSSLGASGAIPPEIGLLQNLQELIIVDNNISYIPPEIGTLTKLFHLQIGGHKVAVIPKEIDNLINLKKLFISGEEITIIEPSFESLSSLETISISLGKTKNYFPDGLTKCSRLRHLSAFFGELESFPTSIRQMRNLESLDLMTSFHGLPVPEWISELAGLKRLCLAGCGLTGEIPSSLGNLDKLEELELQNNNLSGSIPISLTKLSRLTFLALSRNNLSGEIPNALLESPVFKYQWGEILPGNQFDLSNICITAPEFVVTDIDGNQIVAKDIYRNNRFTILMGWRLGEAEDIINRMKKIFNEYKDKGVDMIAWAYASAEEIHAANIPWKQFRRLYENNYFYVNPDPYYTVDFYPAIYVGNPVITVVDSFSRVVWSSLLSNSDIGSFLESQFETDWYVSKDLSCDGEVDVLQTATSNRSINVVLMGDGFSDRQIANGLYEAAMRNTYAAFFSQEPYKSYQDCFNVYSIKVVSMSEGYEHYGQSLGSGFGYGTYVYGNDFKVINYAKKAIPEDVLDDALIIVLMNKDAYAGTCFMYQPDVSGDYGQGLSIAYFPINSDSDTFNSIVSHEAGGHGFAKLGDEYASDMGAVPQKEIDSAHTRETWGWLKNIDFTGDPTQVKWSQFIPDDRYAAENIGCYEGAFTYWTGAWRPTENSIMNHNTGGFNAPSRYAIWYRINKLANGDEWNGTYEDFVAYDAVNRTPAALSKRQIPRNCVEKQLPPLAPPIVVGHSWRDAK